MRLADSFHSRLFLTFYLISLFASHTCAQVNGVNSTTFTPVPGSGHDYIQMLNETVNPYNGSASIRIGLPVPKGRSLTLPFSIGYESTGTHFVLAGGSGGFWSSDLRTVAKGGWSYTLPDLTHKGATKSFPHANPPYNCSYTTDYVFYDPPGGRHNLVLNTGSSGDSRCSTSIFPRLNSGDVFYLANLSQDYSTVTVSNLDGTTYKFAGTQGPIIEDRNGNKITVTYTGAAFNLSDTLGRTALSSSGFGATGNTLTVSGISQPYSLTWGTATSNFTLGITSPVPGQTCANGTNGFPGTHTESQPVITAIQLPNGKQYQFIYDSTYGFLKQITYPSGGWVKYTWGTNPQSEFMQFVNSNGSVASCRVDWFAVLHRYVSFDGVNTALQQDFTYTTTWNGGTQWSTKQTTVVTKDCARSNFVCGSAPSSTTVYTYSPVIVFSNDPINQGAGNQVPVEQTIAYKDGSGNTLRTVSKTWLNMYLVQSEQTTLENNLVSKETYNYVSPGAGVYQALVTEIDEFDYGQGSPGALVKKTSTNYQAFASSPIYPYNPSILDRPCQTLVYDSTGTNLVAETDYFYDGSTSSTPCLTATSQSLGGTGSYTGHDETNYGTSSTAQRGNLTKLVKQCFQGAQTCASGNLATAFIYDETGQTTSTTDANLKTTQFSYTDSYTVLSGGINVNYTPSGNTNAFVTTITDPLTHTQNFTYDFNNSQLTVSKDQNNLTTTYVYNDPFARPTLTTRPDNGTTTVAYNDTALTVTTSKKMNTSQTLASVTLSDGVGHAKQTQLTSDPQGTVYTDTSYDGFGRVYTVSNPYRTGSDPTTSLGTTTFYYDALGRKCLEVPPDGTLPSGGTCPTTQPANTAFTTYSGNTTTVTDQTGKSRKSVTDGLGRMTQVFEDPAGLNYETDYAYDALGNLLCAGQKGTSSGTFTNCASIPAAWHPRTFSYDSLSRLLTSANPETGTITYKYDTDSNCVSPNTFLGLLVSKTDARGVRICAQYDAINRQTVLNYSNGDPTITTTYDEAANCLGLSTCQNIGQRTSLTDAAGSEAWAYQVDTTNFPNSPNIHKEQRTTNAVTKYSTYYADLAGNIAQVVYPTNRVVNYTFDGASRPSTAIDGSNGITYATDFQSVPSGCLAGKVCYTPKGTFYALSIGQTTGFTGLNLTHTYNNRLQPSEFKASSTGGNATDITYNFVDPATSHNAGHVYGITNNLDATRSQNFTYDQLNRITSALTASTYATSPTHCWGEAYTLDAWANLNIIGPTTNPNYTGCTQESGFSTTADSNNKLPIFGYDSSGNTQSDGVVTNYVWDAEGQLKSAAGVTYTYDGDGRRVSKAGSKLYWYGSGGDILAETDTNGNTTAEYIFFAGKRIAMLPTGGNPIYYVEDMLGTSRVLTTNTGVVCYDADFYAYGGERAYTNTCSQNYKFEGKERDTETGNDDFGARYYSNRFGRWLSADWSSAPVPVPYASLSNPQTLNLYAMVADDPESFADLDGHNYFYINGQYVWQEGSDYEYKDKDGKTHKLHSDYNYLVTIELTGRKTKDGATIVKITLKGPGDKVLAEGTGFSGGYVDGHYHDPTTGGRYEINLNKRGGPETNRWDPVNQLWGWDGIQEIARHPAGMPDPDASYQYEWGNMRAHLTPLDGQSIHFYLHGKRLDRASTHGCTCDSNEVVLEKIFSLGPGKVGEGRKRGIIAVSVQ